VNGVEGLEDDYVMHNILDMLAIERMQLVCTSCDTSGKAIARCSTCAEFLCSSCVTAHQKMRCFDSHTVIGFDTIMRSYKENMTRLSAAADENNDNEVMNNKSPSYGSSSGSTNGKLLHDQEDIWQMKRKSSSSSSSTSSSDYKTNFFKISPSSSSAAVAGGRLAIDCGVPIHKPVYCKEHSREPLKFFCNTCQVAFYRFCGSCDKLKWFYFILKL
jgi:hypothetical protein